MRAVDLTPPEERQGGGRGPTRTGSLPYVILIGLALGVIGFGVLALTNKQISEKESQITTLEADLVTAQQRGDAMRPFAEFRAMQELRNATVASLAQSRFDWERVIQELALVVPSDIWLINVTGTVVPDVAVQNSAEITARDSVAGPALELVGCAPSQDSVASFAAALEDIDGVTRVGVSASERPDPDTEVSASGENEEDCRTRDFISRFEIVVAFDAVPAPATAAAPPSTVPGTLAPAPSGQVASTNTATEQAGEAQQAAGTVLPGG